PERGKRPLVDQHRRGHAEGDDIRQAVQLHSELSLGAREPGHPSVEPVEEHGEEDRQCSLVQLARAGIAGAEGEGVEPAEDGSEREEIRQDELELVELHRSPAGWAERNSTSRLASTDGGTLAKWTPRGWPASCCSPPWPPPPTCSRSAPSTGCAVHGPIGRGSGVRTVTASPFTTGARPLAATSSRCCSVMGSPPTT